MGQTLIVYPHQLFETLPSDVKRVWLVEDPLFYYDETVKIKFHKKKLVLHRASMQRYKTYLANLGVDVGVIEFGSSHPSDVFAQLQNQSVRIYDVVNDELRQRIDAHAQENNVEVTWLPTPNFLSDEATLKTHFEGKNHFSMQTFYKAQRKKLNILMSDEESPEGGRYSFDVFNRKKLPRDIDIPAHYTPEVSDAVKAAQTYVDETFPTHPGSVEGFDYPTSHEEARLAMHDFFKHRFEKFGPFQDAIDSKRSILFHSRLSSSLNTGLLSPREVVREAINAHGDIASKEGFIRQIIGWREFMRATYVHRGRRMRSQNVLGHTNPLPRFFIDANSGISPLDNVIKRLSETAYSHHIERLMILGNAFVLMRVHPDVVYRYFMTTHIDAYDWVMVPNVYGMSQYACGNMLTTKPYFSGANYILKMSDYKEGEWSETWNALFYLFLRDNASWLSANPRTRMMVSHLKKKSSDTMRHYETLVEKLGIQLNQ